jgi:hypothetical protein
MAMTVFWEEMRKMHGYHCLNPFREHRRGRLYFKQDGEPPQAGAPNAQLRLP